jgi:Domain of unknown function (DUF4124)
MSLLVKISWVSLTLGCLASFDLSANVDVYKCKDAQGRLNYTDSPCVGSQTISHAKVAEREYQYTPPSTPQFQVPQAERRTTKQKRSSSRSNVNVFAVNEKYNNQIFDEKFKHPRTAELAQLNRNLDRIEKQRQSALRGR